MAEQVLVIVALAAFLDNESLVPMLVCHLIGSVRTKTVVRNVNKGSNGKNALYAGGVCQKKIVRTKGHVICPALRRYGGSHPDHTIWFLTEKIKLLVHSVYVGV